MKRIFLLAAVFALAISACGTSAAPVIPSGAATKVNPSPIAQVDLQATAAVMVQQTLGAIPTFTPLPTYTPVVMTETPTVEPSITAEAATATETAEPAILTLTATLLAVSDTSVQVGTITVTLPSVTLTPSATATTEPTYPQTYGTMPPNLPAGKVVVINQTKVQAYVSVHSTTKDGYISIVEIPVAGKGKEGMKVPAGRCDAVVWVDGKRFSTSFRLSVGGTVTLTITNKGVTAK